MTAPVVGNDPSLVPYVPVGNTGTVPATGTTPHAETTGCSRLCQAV